MINILTKEDNNVMLVIVSDRYDAGVKLFSGEYSQELEDLIDRYNTEFLADTMDEEDYLSYPEDELDDIIDEIEDYFSPNREHYTARLKEVEDYLESTVYIHSEAGYSIIKANMKQYIEKDYLLSYNNLSGIVSMRKVGTEVYMPDSMLQVFLNKNVDYSKYIKFWERCLSNPIPYIRQQLFNWIKSNGLVINNEGLLIGYRAAIKLDFIPSIINNWKANNPNKNIRDYDLFVDTNANFKSGDAYTIDDRVPNSSHISINKNNYVGKWVDTDIFTHWYSTSPRNRKFFTLNKPYSEDVVDINPNNACSKGIHLGSVEFSFSSFGDSLLGCLFCPSKVVSVPNQDSYKLRAYEVFPFIEFKNIDELITFHNDSLKDSNDLLLQASIDYNPDYTPIELSLDGPSSNQVEYIICENDKDRNIIQYQAEKEALERKLENKTIDFRSIVKSRNVKLY